MKLQKIEIDKNTYELTKNYKEAFEKNIFLEKYTDYFKEYDYILGDFSYGSLRLKGFCTKENKQYKPINDIKNIDTYIKNNCAYECKYFILHKIG